MGVVNYPYAYVSVTIVQPNFHRADKLALRVADRVWLMKKGAGVQTGSAENLIVDQATGRFHFE